jgi:hypothetical protein
MPNPYICRIGRASPDPSYLDLNFANIPNGPVPGMLGGTWDVATGKARNNPAIANEKLSNPSFDTDTTDWSSATSTLASIAGGQSNNCLEQTRVSGTAQLVYASTSTVVVGKWYYCVIYTKSGTTGNQSSNLRWMDVAEAIYGLTQFTTSASWVKYSLTARAAATTMKLGMRKGTSTDGTMLYDEASVKELVNLYDLFSVRKFSSPYGSVKGSWTKGVGDNCPMGVVMCLDSFTNPQNFVIVYHDINDQVRLDKCVNGSYTNLIATSTAYGAAKNVMIKRLLGTNTFQAFYGTAGAEAQIGTDQTINDVSIISNTYHGLFDTSPQLNTCSRFIYSAVG